MPKRERLCTEVLLMLCRVLYIPRLYHICDKLLIRHFTSSWTLGRQLGLGGQEFSHNLRLRPKWITLGDGELRDPRCGASMIANLRS